MNENRTYKQGRIYHCLRTNGIHTSRQLCERLGLPINEGDNHPCKAATQILQKLRSHGKVRRVDHLRWEIVPGSIAPRDQRGKTAGSLIALRSHSRANMLKLHLKRGYTLRPQPATALEAAWGWMPRTPSPDLCASSNSVSIDGGTVRPQES